MRCGKVTASKVADVIARTKTGWGASRATYMGQLIAERLTGKPTETFKNAAMEWGTYHEAEARDAYAKLTGYEVTQVSFVDHPTIINSGASPDGLVGKNGLVEIKCPNTITHVETILSDAGPGKYYTQIQWQLACTQREVCDFVSYDPRMPEHMRLYKKTVVLDYGYVKELEEKVSEFLAELDDKVETLRKKFAH
jgi:putative phage-type endonuclease